MTEFETVKIAAALVMSDNQRIMLTWNDNWQGFSLPMTKIETGPPAETTDHAAKRAAAEALHVPTRVVSGKSGKATRALQQSGRDGEIKNYVYTVVPIEIHPDFNSISRDDRPVIWASVNEVIAGHYQPLTSSVSPILIECREWGWL